MFKKIAIHSFLLTFLLMSCASSGGSSKKSTAAQRAVETREYDVSSKDLMQSTIGAFQDLGFTIDTLSEEFGLITASKIEKPKKKRGQKLKLLILLTILIGSGLGIAHYLEYIDIKEFYDNLLGFFN